MINLKKTVNSIFVNGEVTVSLNIETCECEHSKFCDPHHKQIITGGLCINDNSKLRKLMTKRSNYREPRALNFNEAFDDINSAINNCIQDLSNMTKLPGNHFQNENKQTPV